MGIFELVIGLALSGLVVGALARFAVPGPDPLSIWRTILLGIGGSLLGGLLSGLALSAGDRGPTEGGGSALVSFLFAVGGAVLLLVGYRRLHGRTVTGPRSGLPPRDGV